MKHKNFQYGDKVTSFDTNSFIDGMKGKVVGIAHRDIIDMYIIFYDEMVGAWQAVCLPETNLKKVD